MSHPLATLVLLLVASSGALAQDQPDLSWFGRPAPPPQLSEEQDSPQRGLNPLESLATGILGGEQPLGRAFNGALHYGVMLDVVGEFSEADNVDRLNTLRLRSFEFHGAGELSGVGDAYVVADLADGGSGSEFVLREAAAWFSGLPGGLRLRAGKYYADIGAWNKVYVSDLPSLNIDGTRRAYFGGNLALTGLEIHGGRSRDGFGWSIGLAGDIESQDPDVPENGISRISGPGSRTGIKNWAGTARLQMGHPELMFGLSTYFSPGEMHETVEGVLELETMISGIDLSSFRRLGGQRWRQWSMEAWLKQGDTYVEQLLPVPMVVELPDESAFGWWGQLAYGLNATWSLGALASSWEHFSSVTDARGHYLSSFADHAFGPSHRLRFSFSHVNPGPGIQKFYAVGVHWTLGFGAPRTTRYHRHPRSE